MDAVIIANGEFRADKQLADLWANAGLRIAADGGARNAREQLGLTPHVVIGDLDSLDSETRYWLEVAKVEFIQHPVAKDETDLELAIMLAHDRGAERVTVLGAWGGRADQSIANVLLLTLWPDLVLRDMNQEMWVAKNHATIAGQQGNTVSLIPVDEKVEGIVTQNLLYPLRSETLVRGTTRGVSNQMLGLRAEVEWERGLLLIVHSVIK